MTALERNLPDSEDIQTGRHLETGGYRVPLVEKGKIIDLTQVLEAGQEKGREWDESPEQTALSFAKTAFAYFCQPEFTPDYGHLLLAELATQELTLPWQFREEFNLQNVTIPMETVISATHYPNLPRSIRLEGIVRLDTPAVLPGGRLNTSSPQEDNAERKDLLFALSSPARQAMWKGRTLFDITRSTPTFGKVYERFQEYYAPDNSYLDPASEILTRQQYVNAVLHRAMNHALFQDRFPVLPRYQTDNPEYLYPTEQFLSIPQLTPANPHRKRELRVTRVLRPEELIGHFDQLFHPFATRVTHLFSSEGTYKPLLGVGSDGNRVLLTDARNLMQEVLTEKEKQSLAAKDLRDKQESESSI